MLFRDLLDVESSQAPLRPLQAGRMGPRVDSSGLIADGLRMTLSADHQLRLFGNCASNSLNQVV
jgi:hypothetical protein